MQFEDEEKNYEWTTNALAAYIERQQELLFAIHVRCGLYAMACQKANEIENEYIAFVGALESALVILLLKTASKMVNFLQHECE